MPPPDTNPSALLLRWVPLHPAAASALVEHFGVRLASNPTVTGEHRRRWLAAKPRRAADAARMCSMKMELGAIAGILDIEARITVLRSLAQYNDRPDVATAFAAHPFGAAVEAMLPPQGERTMQRFYQAEPPLLGPVDATLSLRAYQRVGVTDLLRLRPLLRRDALGFFAAELGCNVECWAAAFLLADAHNGSLYELAELAAATTAPTWRASAAA